MEVCILNTINIFEAELAKSQLDGMGIFCELRTSDAGGMLPHLRYMQGAQLFVTENDKEKALQILRSSSTSQK